MGSRFHCHHKHKVSKRTPAPRWGAIEVPRKERRGEKLKYLTIGEWCPEDWEKIIERANVSFSERDEGTDKYPEFLYQPHSLIGKHKVFTVYKGTPRAQKGMGDKSWQI